MYEYRANINRVVDGDTVDCDIELGFGVVLCDERVRIMGIDTPESSTADMVEKVFGLAANSGGFLVFFLVYSVLLLQISWQRLGIVFHI